MRERHCEAYKDEVQCLRMKRRNQNTASSHFALLPCLTSPTARNMGGPNRGSNAIRAVEVSADGLVEVFKFGCYVFFPVLAMLKFGDPEW